MDRRRNTRGRLVALGLLGALGLGFTGTASRGDDPPIRDRAAPGTLRDGFETPDKAWRQEQPDAAIEIFSHERTNRAAHEGQQSEGFEFKAGVGGGLYYSYAVPPIPISDDLKATLWVRSNRPGMQMLARVVLPNDVDPETKRPSFVLITSSLYEAADRWEKLELADMLPAIERQARVLRASSRRRVPLDGAYVERVVINIYGGEGPTEVYLDDLTIAPVPAEVVAAHDRKLGRGPILADDEPAALPDKPRARSLDGRARAAAPLDPSLPTASERIKYDRNRLLKDGLPWFPTMMRAPEVDPGLMMENGCDLVVVPADADDEYLATAIRDGLYVVPELAGEADPEPEPFARRSRPIDPARALRAAANFPRKEHVFAWSLGDDLGSDPDLGDRTAALAKARAAVVVLRQAKPGGVGLATGMVVGSTAEYARQPENLDLLGFPARTWAAARGPLEPYWYLKQRNLLTARANPNALLWSEIDATAPALYRRLIWGMDRPADGDAPQVQPDHVRLATYTALAAGCRGLSFRADGNLATGLGRAVLNEIALLNEEIDLIEPIVADPDHSIRDINAYLADPPPPQQMTFLQMNFGSTNKPPQVKEFPPHPTIKGMAISTKDRRGCLVVVQDFAPYAQFQPPQMAINKIRLLVPAANDALAYQISPGGVRPLDSVRTPGGHHIWLDDFGVTTLILMTTNVDLKNEIERAVNANRPRAVSMAIEEAQVMRDWVVEVDARLRLDGHDQKDWTDLIAKADALLKSARDAFERPDYLIAFEEARRVGRPLRALMYYHFMAAYDAIRDDIRNENFPCGPTKYEGAEKPQPQLVSPIVAAPLASFNTLPQAWIWEDHIKHGRLGESVVPGGHFDFEDEKAFFDAGWTKESYQLEGLNTTLALRVLGPDNAALKKGGYEEDETKKNLALGVTLRKGVRLDSLVPYADHPTVAVRSPSFPVRAREMYRISVMVRNSNVNPPGVGGVIVRDSIGGERCQFRTSEVIDKDWYQVVYYRQIPADGEMSILLGMASIAGFVAFDDLRVEPIVEQIAVDDRPRVVPVKRPAKRDPKDLFTGPPTTAPSDRPIRRSATHLQPLPIRQ